MGLCLPAWDLGLTFRSHSLGQWLKEPSLPSGPWATSISSRPLRSAEAGLQADPLAIKSPQVTISESLQAFPSAPAWCQSQVRRVVADVVT